MASSGLVLIRFLLVWGSLGLVRFDFEVWGTIRFPGFPVNLHFRGALLKTGRTKVRFHPRSPHQPVSMGVACAEPMENGDHPTHSHNTLSPRSS